jgi:ribose transport system substrate-binding protein
MPATIYTYFTAYIDAMEQRAAELGVDVVFSDAEDDPATQNEQVASFATQGVDAIVVPAVDVAASAVGITDLATSDIPIVTSNRFVNAPYGGPGGENPKIHVGFSDYEIGVQEGELIVEACAEHDPCNLVIEEGTPGSSPQIERTRGIEDVIAAHPNIVIIDKQPNNFDKGLAITVTEAILTAHDDIDVLVTHDDASAVGAIEAIEAAERQDEITVIGVGGSIEGVQAILDGRMYGTVWVSPRQDGINALETAVALALGNEPAGLIETEGRPTVPVPIAKATQSNIEQYPGEW